MGLPIGIFDSGLGGLTVVRALRRRLPRESVVYFGDSARVPYGTKSSETIIRFASEDCEFLCRHDPKLIVVACNTASATALPVLARRFHQPVLGVIEPGARAAAEACGDRPIGIVGTEATVLSGAYRRAVQRRRPGSQVVEKACPLLVPLVEEGRRPADPIVRLALQEYLSPLQAAGVGSVVLGCTHYPLLAEAFAEVLGPNVTLVDSAEAVAEEIEYILGQYRLLEPAGTGRMDFFVSDNPARFREVGRRFLGEEIESVSHVPPEEFFFRDHGSAPTSVAAGGAGSRLEETP
jgi:glutamate racemase